MTIEEYNKLKEEFYKKEMESYKNTLKLFKDKDPDYTKYDAYYIINCEHLLAADLYGLELQEVKAKIDEAVKKLEELKAKDTVHINSNFLDIYRAICTDDDDICIRVYYKELAPERDVDAMIQNRWGHKISMLLHKGIETSYRSIDDKLLELFEAGKLDWSALQKRVYMDLR